MSTPPKPDQPVPSDATPSPEVAKDTLLEHTKTFDPAMCPVLDASTTVDAGSTFGQYQIESKLGQGGMGAVWKALHIHLEKPVALKVLPKELTRDAQLVARFEREMKAVGKLEHPHIVRAMDAGAFEGTHFLVMEYVEGLDFAKLVRSKGPRSIIEACELVRQASLGLAHAHKNGLVHRDIKPSNLLLTTQGKVKILDLGLALLQSPEDQPTELDAPSLTVDGMCMGTPDYMAPEQWENTHAVDGRADLYALGCTIYFLLTGNPPYGDAAHKSFSKKLVGHTLEAVPDLKLARPEIPDELNQVYLGLMAKNPEQRTSNATDLAKDLAAVIRGLKSPTKVKRQRGEQTAVVQPSAKRTQLAKGKSAPKEWTDEATELEHAAPTIDDFPVKHAPVRRSSRQETRPAYPIWLAVGFTAFLVLAGIIIKITTRDGTTTTIKVPEEATVEVIRDGKVGGELPKKPQPLSPTPVATAGSERTVAEWVLANGGSVSVWHQGGLVNVAQTGELPVGPLVLDSLTLTHKPNIAPEDWPSLSHLKAIRIIGVGFTPVDDQWCEQIGELKTLEHFSATGTRISDAGAQHLGKLSRLVTLDVQNTDITETGVAHLVGLQRLRSLGLGCRNKELVSQLNDQIWLHLANFPRLENLIISDNKLTSDGVKLAPALSRLRHLTVANSQLLDDRGFENFPIFPELVTASFSGNSKLTVSGLEAFLQRSPAAAAWIDQKELSAEQLESLQQACNRTAIMFPKNVPDVTQKRAGEWILDQEFSGFLYIPPGSSRPLSQNDSLPDVSFFIYMLTANKKGEDVVDWSSFPKVRTLDVVSLSGDTLNDGDLKQVWPTLAEARLRQLSLSAKQVTPAGLIGLARQTKLTNLVLVVPQLTDDAVQELGKLKRISELAILAAEKLTDKSFETIGQFSELIGLSLQSGGTLSGDELKHLSSLHELKRLQLIACRDSSLAPLGKLPELTILSLNNTPVTDDGLIHLAKCRGLRVINLQSTKVTMEGVSQLQKALPEATIFWSNPQLPAETESPPPTIISMLPEQPDFIPEVTGPPMDPSPIGPGNENPSPPNNKPPAPKVIQIGDGEGMVSDLNQAFASANGGDSIEIATDEPIRVSSVIAWNKPGRLTVRAAAGKRPIIIVETPDNFQMLQLVGNDEGDPASHSVRFDGLTIVDFREKPADTIYASNRALAFENILFATRCGTMVRSDGKADLKIDRCYLWSRARSVSIRPAVHVLIGSDKKVSVTNSLFAGHSYFAIGDTTELNAERNTFVGNKHPWVLGAGQITLTCTRNLFWGTQNIVLIGDLTPKFSPAVMAQAIQRINRYRATSNVYFECARLCEQISQNAQSDLAAWQIFTRNGEATPQFIDPQPMNREVVAESQFRLLSPQQFALRSSTPLKRLKIGAEIRFLPDFPPGLNDLLPEDIRPAGKQ